MSDRSKRPEAGADAGYCAGFGVDAWVQRRGQALIVAEQSFSEEDESGQRPVIRARVRIPRNAVIDVERKDERTPSGQVECFADP